MNPEDMGVTGLAQWVNSSEDLYEFHERRNRAEDVIAQRYGAEPALRFVLCCDDKPAAKLQLARQRERWRQCVERAYVWAEVIREDLLLGRPVSIHAEPRFRSDLELAFDIATGKCAPKREATR